jgi:hypothetical protein
VGHQPNDDLVDLNAGERAVLLQPKRQGADLVEMIRRGPDLNPHGHLESLPSPHDAARKSGLLLTGGRCGNRPPCLGGSRW